MPKDLVRPCFQVLPQEPTCRTSPIPPCHPPQWAMSPRSHLGGARESPAPLVQACPSIPGSSLSAPSSGSSAGAGGEEVCAAARWDPGAAFQVGMEPQRALCPQPPLAGAALSPHPRRAQWDIVQSRKGPLVQPPAPGALGSLLGSAQGGRGHQRGLLGAHVLMSPPGPPS